MLFLTGCGRGERGTGSVCCSLPSLLLNKAMPRSNTHTGSSSRPCSLPYSRPCLIPLTITKRRYSAVQHYQLLWIYVKYGNSLEMLWQHSSFHNVYDQVQTHQMWDKDHTYEMIIIQVQFSCWLRAQLLNYLTLNATLSFLHNQVLKPSKPSHSTSNGNPMWESSPTTSSRTLPAQMDTKSVNNNISRWKSSLTPDKVVRLKPSGSDKRSQMVCWSTNHMWAGWGQYRWW